MIRDTELENLLRAKAPSEGENLTACGDLRIYRFTGGRIGMPQFDTPYLYVVAGGSMRLHTPSGIMDYIAGQYSVSAIDTPLYGDILTLSVEGDFISLALGFTLNDVVSVAIDLDQELTEQIMENSLPAEAMSEADDNVIRAVIRLVEVLDRPGQLSFMEKHIRREIIFHILCGSCGKQFLQSMIGIRQAGDIYEINSWIKENFRESFTVEELAEKNGMSVSLLHQRFKSAVGMGLLQCQKRLRLTEARRLMLDEDRNVTEASGEVGYDNMSQFIREYKKMFGKSPKEDIVSLRAALKK